MHKKKNIIKLSTQMKLGIKYKDILIDKIPRILITRLESFISDILYSIDKNFISVICGYYRRQKDFSSDVDVLITNKNLILKDNSKNYLKIVIDALSKYLIIDNLTINYNTHFQGFISFKNIPDLPNSYDKTMFDVNKNVIRIDIILVPEQYFYTALMHFTGSSNFKCEGAVTAVVGSLAGCGAAINSGGATTTAPIG